MAAISPLVLTMKFTFARRLPYLHWITLLSASTIAGCAGGVLKFDQGASAQTTVQENTTAALWQAHVKLDGPGVLTGLSYKIAGPDADLFSISSDTGELHFKQAADFEQPSDADKNNEYSVQIVANANNQTTSQTLQIKVEDVVTPQISLVQPQMNQNVGSGQEITIEGVIRLFDAESNTPLKNAALTVNNQLLTQDATNPELFSGKFLVPAGGLELSILGSAADNKTITTQGRYLNKIDVIKPDFISVNPGLYLLYIDKHHGKLGKIYFSDLVEERYLVHSNLQSINPIFDFNSLLHTLYVSYQQTPGQEQLFGFSIDTGSAAAYTAGCLSSKIVNITFDALNRRTLAVVKSPAGPSEQYNVLTFPIDETNGFVGGKKDNTQCFPANENSVWTLPPDVIKGEFKQFAFHRVTGTFVIADERTVNKKRVTIIQGFSENGDKRFESSVGPDISNITINNSKGIIYVAENHQQATGTIKTIDVKTGKVGDLLASIGTNTVGSYSDIRIDNVNQRLYIADVISNSFFVVNLASNTMTELVYKPQVDVSIAD